jgi:hypothetical protein
MKLHAALGASLTYTGGADPEIGAAWTRALEIAEGLDNAEYRWRSLWGRGSPTAPTVGVESLWQKGSVLWRRTGPIRMIG